MWFDAQVVSCKAAVFHRIHDPVRAKTDFVHKFTDDGCNFCGINTVGAEERTSAAFGALIGIVEEFFDDIFIPGTRTNFLPEKSSEHRVITAIQGAKKFCPKNWHVFGIVCAKEEMTFVCACTTADADIHEEFE